MKRLLSCGALVLAFAVSGTARAEAVAPGVASSASPPVTWTTSLSRPQSAVVDVRWARSTSMDLKGTSVLVLRRPATDSDRPGPISIGPEGRAVLAAEFVDGSKTDASCRGAVDASTRDVEAGKALGDWMIVGVVGEQDAGSGHISDDSVDPTTTYVYALLAARPGEQKNRFSEFLGAAYLTAPIGPRWFANERWFYFVFALVTAIALFGFTRLAKTRGKQMFIRRIAGIDALEDAVGRSTEMGRPILYVTGIEEIQDIQTIASVLILGHVAQMTAEYDTEIKVANFYPMTMVVAEEIVRNGYANAGRMDAHKPENVMFITSEQFAFAAAVNGIILRDRPATNIYFGRFFAESLILSETGYLTGAVQIAGTAEFTQLPFFIAACDYTLIGEELYATSAYLSREPDQLAQIKSSDAMKAILFVLVSAGVIATTFFGYDLVGKLIP
jgi:hypothetical protein